jgi:ADP-ribose pyrophosphatase YjhB (NUDIX family)
MAGDLTLERPVPVVRIIIQNGRGEVLFLRREGTTYGDKGWCLPGGKIDYGETVEHAARRELREETQVECKSTRFLFFQDSLPPTPSSMHCINFYFECEVSDDRLMSHRSDDWAWIGPGDLHTYETVFQNDEGARRFWDMG